MTTVPEISEIVRHVSALPFDAVLHSYPTFKRGLLKKEGQLDQVGKVWGDKKLEKFLVDCAQKGFFANEAQPCLDSTGEDEEVGKNTAEGLEGDDLVEWSDRQKRPDFHNVPHVSQITSELFLGSRHGIEGEAIETLRKRVHVLSSFELKLTAVVNVAAGEVQYSLPDGLLYHSRSIADSPDTPLLPWLDETTDFIEDCIKKGGACFVHCKGGYSRSASVVIAYLIKHRGLSYDLATRVTKHGRPNIDPNSGFVKQLKGFEERCRKKR